MERWDREFFVAAGLDLGAGISRFIPVHFYPEPAQVRLLELEAAARDPNRGIDDIRRTIFGVRAGDSGFEYYVIEIRYKL